MDFSTLLLKFEALLSAIQLLVNKLNYSILHLIISGQDKTKFLELVEASLVNRDKDDALAALLAGELEVLCINLP